MNYMMYNYGTGYGFGLPLWAPVLILLLVIWSFLWKGLALWHSARRKQGWWFVILLVVNTGGILELIYLFLVAKIPASELFDAKK
jgi:methionyl-tRNA synthetase